jgi:hypothetical protein
MIKAASTSETSINFYQTTRRNNPEEAIFSTNYVHIIRPKDVSDNFSGYIKRPTKQLKVWVVSAEDETETATPSTNVRLQLQEVTPE